MYSISMKEAMLLIGRFHKIMNFERERLNIEKLFRTCLAIILQSPNVMGTHSFLDFQHLFKCISHLFYRMLINLNAYDAFFWFDSGCVYLAGVSQQLCGALIHPNRWWVVWICPSIEKVHFTSLRWSWTCFSSKKLHLFHFCH